MKSKLLLIVGTLIIVIIVAVGCSMFYQIMKEQFKKSNEHTAKKKYEELISFCTDNQTDIEEISIELNEIIKGIDANLFGHISNPEWKQLSKRLDICYPEEFDKSLNIVTYQDCSYGEAGPYSLYVVWFDESEEKIQDYLKGRFAPPSHCTKISEHLYVCLFERQQV